MYVPLYTINPRRYIERTMTTPCCGRTVPLTIREGRNKVLYPAHRQRRCTACGTKWRVSLPDPSMTTDNIVNLEVRSTTILPHSLVSRTRAR